MPSRVASDIVNKQQLTIFITKNNLYNKIRRKDEKTKKNFTPARHFSEIYSF